MELGHDKVCVYLLNYTLISGSILSVSHTYTWIKDVCFLSLTLVIIRKLFLKKLSELSDVTQLNENKRRAVSVNLTCLKM